MTARRRPASRPSRRRCFLASRRVEPLTFCGSVMSSGSRGLRTLTTVFAGSSAAARDSSPLRRRGAATHARAPRLAAGVALARAPRRTERAPAARGRSSDVVDEHGGSATRAPQRSDSASCGPQPRRPRRRPRRSRRHCAAESASWADRPRRARRMPGLLGRRLGVDEVDVATLGRVGAGGRASVGSIAAVGRPGPSPLVATGRPGLDRPSAARRTGRCGASAPRAGCVRRCSRCLPPSLVHSYAGWMAAPSSVLVLERSCALRGTANPSLLRPAGCLCRHVSRVPPPTRMRCILKASLASHRARPGRLLRLSHALTGSRGIGMPQYGPCPTPPARPGRSRSPSSSSSPAARAPRRVRALDREGARADRSEHVPNCNVGVLVGAA